MFVAVDGGSGGATRLAGSSTDIIMVFFMNDRALQDSSERQVQARGENASVAAGPGRAAGRLPGTDINKLPRPRIFGLFSRRKGIFAGISPGRALSWQADQSGDRANVRGECDQAPDPEW